MASTKLGIKPYPATIGPIVVLACAALLWGTSLQRVDLSRMTDLGLVSVLPLSTYAALTILTVSFCIVVHQRPAHVLVLFLHVAMLIIMLNGTHAILYGTLRYSWAWKHVGIVDYILRHHSVDPNIGYLSAFHNWPGFFAMSALFTEIAGFESALSFAGAAPIFFNIIYVGALLLILNTLTQDGRLVWLTIWFFFLANWVDQDYFSPQALNYFLYLVILGVCLRWFAVTRAPSKLTIKRWLLFDRVVSIYHGLVTRAMSSNAPDFQSRPLERVGLMGIIILVFIVVASSHQLTPSMTAVALAALVVFQRSRARSLPILMVVLTISWAIYMARPFLDSDLQIRILPFLQLAENIERGLIDLSLASPGHRVVAIAGRSLTALMMGLALVGGVVRLRHGSWDLSSALLTIAPFAMIAGSAYGGEVLFRAYLFALPFMAFFAAALMYPSSQGGTSWRTVAMVTLLSITLLTGLLLAKYGKERQSYFTRGEIDAAHYLYSTAPKGSLLIEGARNYPTQFLNYELFTYVPLTREPQASRSRVIDSPVKVLSSWMNNKDHPAAYLIITRSQKALVDSVGIMPSGSLDSIEQALTQSQEFRVIYGNEDAKIFALANGADE